MNAVLKIILQRLALGVLTLFIVSIVIFLAVNMLPGDFAEAIGAVLQDGETARTVLGATNGAPLVVDGPYSDDAVRAAIDAQPDMDAYDRQVHFIAAKRAAMIAGVRAA